MHTKYRPVEVPMYGEVVTRHTICVGLHIHRLQAHSMKAFDVLKIRKGNIHLLIESPVIYGGLPVNETDRASIGGNRQKQE